MDGQMDGHRWRDGHDRDRWIDGHEQADRHGIVNSQYYL